MTFTKQTWVDDVHATDAATMNRIEQGIADAHDKVLTGDAAGLPAAADHEYEIRVDARGISWFSNGFAWVPMGPRGSWAPVEVAAVTDQALTGKAGATVPVDGVAISPGQRFLLTGQDAAHENGIYTYQPPGVQPGEFVRTEDASHSRHFRNGQTVHVKQGTFTGQTFTYTPFVDDEDFVLGTDGAYFTAPTVPAHNHDSRYSTLKTAGGVTDVWFPDAHWGEATVSHGLGTTPRGVTGNLSYHDDGRPQSVGFKNLNSTTFYAVCRDWAGSSPGAGITRKLYWIAFA